MTSKRLFSVVLAPTKDKWAWWDDEDVIAGSSPGEPRRLQSVSQYGVLCHQYSQVACLEVQYVALVVARCVVLRCFALVCV